jgi:murein L,D-transpeptidase YafK
MKKSILIMSILIIALGVYYFYPTKKCSSFNITAIEVYKSKRKMYLYANDVVVNSYTISLGGNPIGKKTEEGDQKTPEGIYKIDDKNAHSSCYKNLSVSYPNTSDRANGYTGGLIKIHGLKNGFGFVGKFHRFYDWTDGCIAVTNLEMEELFQNVTIGTKLIIYP